MPFALSLAADNATADPLRALWDEFAAFERAPSQRGLGYRPHVTLAIYEGDAIDEAAALRALESAAQGERAVRLVFDRIATFEDDLLVFWAAPRPNEALNRLHRAIHSQIDQACCHVHYRPRQWTPHATLASDIDPAQAAKARALAAAFSGVVTVDFDLLDCISFRPVRIVGTRRLSPQ